jgi:hypothetical protein
MASAGNWQWLLVGTSCQPRRLQPLAEIARTAPARLRLGRCRYDSELILHGRHQPRRLGFDDAGGARDFDANRRHVTGASMRSRPSSTSYSCWSSQTGCVSTVLTTRLAC